MLSIVIYLLISILFGIIICFKGKQLYFSDYHGRSVFSNRAY